MARNRFLFGIPDPFNRLGKSLRSFSAPPKSANYNHNIDVARKEAKKIIDQKIEEIKYLTDCASSITQNFFSVDIPFAQLNKKYTIMSVPIVTAELSYKNGFEISGSSPLQNRVVIDIKDGKVDFSNSIGVNLSDVLSVDFSQLGFSIKQKLLTSCENIDCTVVVNYRFSYIEIIYKIKGKQNNAYIVGELKFTIIPIDMQKKKFYRRVFQEVPVPVAVNLNASNTSSTRDVLFKTFAVGLLLAATALAISTFGASTGVIAGAAALL